MDISKQSQARIVDLAAMPRAAQFEKIAMNIKNPQIYRQFLASEEDADIAEYAYAAGLISKGDKDGYDNLVGQPTNPVAGPLNPGDLVNPGEPSI